MLEAIKQIFRARALKKNASKVETSLLKLSDIHSAAVFIDVEDTSWEEAKNMLVRYFRDRGIRAELFFFDFRKLDEGERLITSITNTILKRICSGTAARRRRNSTSCSRRRLRTFSFR